MGNQHSTRRAFLIQGMVAAAAANVSILGNNAFADETILDARVSRFKILLDQNWKYSQGDFFNDPKETIEYLKSQARFKQFSLVDVPKFAVILHDARPEDFLARLGNSQHDFWQINTGDTDPTLLYFIYGQKGTPDFILNRGLPGAGGVTTQAAELAAMGVKSIVHIGTCGLVGPKVPEGTIVVADGSYKDAGAVMISKGSVSETDWVARPTRTLTDGIQSVLRSSQIKYASAVGYTIPVFYFQPADLIRNLITGKEFPGGPSIGFFEMEQASLFETGRRMGIETASMVTASDRYIVSGGKVTHVNYNEISTTPIKQTMLEVAVRCFKNLYEPR